MRILTLTIVPHWSRVCTCATSAMYFIGAREFSLTLQGFCLPEVFGSESCRFFADNAVLNLMSPRPPLEEEMQGLYFTISQYPLSMQSSMNSCPDLEFIEDVRSHNFETYPQIHTRRSVLNRPKITIRVIKSRSNALDVCPNFGLSGLISILR